MAGYISSARYMYDENNIGFVEVVFNKFSGEKTVTIKESIETWPKGDWTVINFSLNDFMSYPKFLETMVHNNLVVARKIAHLKLDDILENSYNKHVRLVKRIPILDNTFVPPILNLNCSWQRRLLWDLTDDITHDIIAKCNNKQRLVRYSSSLDTV